jgi:hypothetical protein
MHGEATENKAGTRNAKPSKTLLACLLASLCTWGVTSVCEASSSPVRLEVSARVASACAVNAQAMDAALDLSSALQISCGASHNVLVQQGPIKIVSIDGVSARFVEATILF